MEVNAEKNIKKSLNDDKEQFLVLMNHEGQYSLWPSYKSIPVGWKEVFSENTKEKCLAYVENVWTDMRPLSLQKKMKKEE